MSQSSILKIIEKSRKPISVKQLMKKTGLAQSSVGHALTKLIKQGEVKRMAIKQRYAYCFVYWTNNDCRGVVAINNANLQETSK